MKKNTHPKMREVVFQDSATGTMFKMTSTIDSKDTVKFYDGNVYPVIMLERTSASHPAYKDGVEVARTSSRVEKFEKKYQRRKG